MKRLPIHQRGFTLVELLVALLIMAVLSGLGWRSVDVLLNSERVNREASTRSLTLQAALTQWSYDLDAATVNLIRPPVQMQGNRLIVVRRMADSDALMVVAWWRGEREINGKPEQMWLRWQSLAIRTRGELEREHAAALANGLATSAQTVALLPTQQMTIRFFRNGVWLDPTDARETANPSPTLPGDPASRALALADSVARQFQVPDGVQLELQLVGLSGPLRKDWSSSQVVPRPS